MGRRTVLRADLVIRKGRLALDARFEVPMEGITVIQGPSGCGKTSLLRAIAGFDRHAGSVVMGTTTWQDARRFVPVHRRNLGYVFQESALLPHLTVKGNLRYVMRHQPVVDRLDEVARQTGIGALLPRAIAGLSGGEHQRVALACAILPKPDLLLMDEPLSSLDQTARAELLPLICGLDLPVLYVTHDPAEAAFLASRVLTISGNRLVETPLSADPLHGRPHAEIEALARAALAQGLTI